MTAQVLVLLGSASDKPVFEKAKTVFDELGIKWEVHVASAHRTPQKVVKLVESSKADVFIGIAGLSAALPGVIAAHTTKPVIGVPVDSKLGGLDALLSAAQLPPGIPVASVGIDRGENAALLAAAMLALKEPELGEKLASYRKKMREKIEADDESAQKW
jgi:5-(carboxyamino)imidazole ribonucleotide mutase